MYCFDKTYLEKHLLTEFYKTVKQLAWRTLPPQKSSDNYLLNTDRAPKPEEFRLLLSNSPGILSKTFAKLGFYIM